MADPAPVPASVPAAAPSDLTAAVTKMLLRDLGGAPDARKLELALRALGKWRSSLLANTLIKRSGNKVLTGPFAGMDYSVPASEGARAARLMGSYEASLAPVFEAVIAKRYRQVIDIGCAEG